MPSGASKDSLKEYVKSIAAPGTNTANIFGLKTWMSSSRGEAVAPLMENEDNFEDPSQASSNASWFGSDTSNFLGLSRKQRVIGFMTCLCLGSICFTVAGFTIPFIAFKARKFATLFTLGSFFCMSSFSLLWGPWAHLKHVCSRERLPFTSVYVASLAATLYCSLHLHSTALTVVCALCQLVALVWFVACHIPGGERGLRFFSTLCSSAVRSTASRTLPV
ncbi:Protein transport protein SFT2 [Amphibalanus amphitrite]|uniref:Vesicle transport protein n=1 Tax=Amphibalanus amphitrite TaxID=1232801 RepID=A0A6A4VTR4_AMPAM|nr:protein transport protein SFT2-like [Amphibalanus amphitrite]XP_043228652.1 protein transport protein SFT2-like [Amphibalanus amphitrite]XP_043228660.1 protein transport protein SFT2-like [Amphibalanus amphitrite]XP_043228671.1 protein transport protein SFT2-like [Amphibalanus amphitrite]XP_043228680.1 protein transport protein SFT2-like [Amphibalanus amphitrite]KAF0294142.1 Protein transport protein SFT2 [Amphibalanus amphitrite]KAF0294143.1 Protein transport protein SFT2 [Amphibalanus am